MIEPSSVEAEDEPEVDRPSPIVMRLAAAIIDFTIVAVVVLPIQLAWTTSGGAGGPDRVPTTASNWLALAIIVGYPIVGIAHYGKTIGKHACSLQVVRLDGGPVGWVRSIVRFTVSFAPLLAGPLLQYTEGAARAALSVVQVALVALVYLPILTDAARRGLHDRIAGTRVMSKVPHLLRAPTPSVGGQG